MFFLLVMVCTSSSMLDCQEFTMGQYRDAFACEVAAGRAEVVLGQGPDQNYRFECVEEEK